MKIIIPSQWSGPALFYRARIPSVLSYSAPCWYTHVLENSKTKLEMYQKYCTRLILYDEEDNDNRLKLDNLLQILGFHFVSKASVNKDPINSSLNINHLIKPSS